MGIIVGGDNYCHLTTESNLSPTLWILQPDLEVLLHLGDVIIYDVHRYLQLTVPWCKLQLPETECDQVKETQLQLCLLLWFSIHKKKCLYTWV